jgi:ankyrin repeat protein
MDSLIHCIAGAVVRGVDDPEWEFLYSNTIPMLEVKGFHLARPVAMVKDGARDSGKITQGCDTSDKQLMEDILDLVKNPGTIRFVSLFGVAVCEAIEANDLNKLRSYLSLGYPVNRCCPNLTTGAGNKGITALHYAIFVGTDDATALLLQHSGDPTQRDEDGDSAFSMAIGRDKYDVCKQFLQCSEDSLSVPLQVALNYLNIRGKHPLETVFYTWNQQAINFVEMLVNNAHITISSQIFSEKDNNIARVMMHRLSDAMIEDTPTGYRLCLIILALGYPPNFAFAHLHLKSSGDQTGITPLYFACHNGRPDIVQLLLDGGADPNVEVASAVSLIDTVLFGNNASEEIAIKLIKAGVSPNRMLDNGNGTVTFASVVHKRWYSLFEECLLHGGDCLIPSPSGCHLFCLAAQEDLRETVPVLVKCLSARVVMGILNARQPRQQLSWPLLASVYSKNHEMTRLLLEAGADPNMQMLNDSRSCLHIAVLSGDFLTVRLLVQHGANVNVRSTDNLPRPLDFAINKKHVDIALFLVERGSDPNEKVDVVPGSPESFRYAEEPFRTQLLQAWRNATPGSGSFVKMEASSPKAVAISAVQSLPGACTPTKSVTSSSSDANVEPLDSFRARLQALSVSSPSPQPSQSLSPPASSEKAQSEGGRAAGNSEPLTKTPVVITGASSLPGHARNRHLSSSARYTTPTAASSSTATTMSTLKPRPVSVATSNGTDTISHTLSQSTEMDECCVCFSKPKNATLLHSGTGHLCCCYDCGRDMKDRAIPCPICRQPIEMVIITYPA